jgi:Holliday junction resolvase RusA-like endonuclease
MPTVRGAKGSGRTSSATEGQGRNTQPQEFSDFVQEMPRCPTLKAHITLKGISPSKKNRYLPIIRGGHATMIKDKKLQGELDLLELQIPLYSRTLKLQHPHIVMQFYVDKTNGTSRDRDNMAQMTMDLLVHAGVLYDDRIKRNNGFFLMPPAVIGTENKTEVYIFGDN